MNKNSDSSRFWNAAEWKAGSEAPSYDKQYVRDYLTSSGLKGKPNVSHIAGDACQNRPKSAFFDLKIPHADTRKQPDAKNSGGIPGGSRLGSPDSRCVNVVTD